MGFEADCIKDVFCIAIFRSNGLALGLNIQTTALKQHSPEDLYYLCINV